MKRIKEVYVGVFEIGKGERPAETILTGLHQRPGGGMEVRATIEHEMSALPSLIVFCQEISDRLHVPWRLLKYSSPEEVDKKTVDEYRELCTCTGACH